MCESFLPDAKLAGQTRDGGPAARVRYRDGGTSPQRRNTPLAYAAATLTQPRAHAWPRGDVHFRSHHLVESNRCKPSEFCHEDDVVMPFSARSLEIRGAHFRRSEKPWGPTCANEGAVSLG